MAKGYPTRQDSTSLPECKACGSHLFREGRNGLRCEDCEATLPDPFKG